MSDEVVLDLAPLKTLPRRKGRLVVHGTWGPGPDQFGHYVRPFYTGPTSFDVTPSGGVVIVDEQNSRIVLHERGKHQVVVRGIRPIYYDVAVDADAIHLLAIDGGGDLLRSFRINDGSLIAARSVGNDADTIRVVAGDLYVHSFSDGWRPAAALHSPGRPEIPIEHGGQILLGGGRGKSVTITKSDVGGSTSWRLASAENLGVVTVTSSPRGVRAVLVRWTDTTRSYQYVDLGTSGELKSFVMPDQHFAEMTAGAEFRFVGDSLYRAASTRQEFSIYRYVG